MTKRLKPEDRRAAILDAAVEYAQVNGYVTMTRNDVAKAAGVSPGLVTFYFLHTRLLKAEVMQAAVNREILSVVAEGLAIRDPHALSAPTRVRAAAIATL